MSQAPQIVRISVIWCFWGVGDDVRVLHLKRGILDMEEVITR